MEPSSLEKLESLREHVEFLRLEYDVCEKKQERKRILEELDRLTCELIVAEEAAQHEAQERNQKNDFSGKSSNDRSAFWTMPLKCEERLKFEKNNEEDPRDEEESLQPVRKEWLGRLIRNEKGDVHRLLFIDDDYIRVEKQRFLFDPVRWVSVDNRHLSYGIGTLWRPLTPSEIFFPRLQYSSVQQFQRRSMDPSWIGKKVKKRATGEICKFLSCSNGVCLLQNEQGMVKLVPEHSSEWELFGTNLQPSWIGKLVRDGDGKTFRVLSKHSEVGAWRVCRIEYTSGGLPNEKGISYIPDDSVGWSLAEEKLGKKDKGKEKVR